MRIPVFYVGVAILLAAPCFNAIAGDATPAVQKTEKKFDALKTLKSLKDAKCMYMKSCECDPDPYYASMTFEKRLKQVAEGKEKLCDYKSCLVDLLEGYPPRFDAETWEVKAKKALRTALADLIKAGAPVNGEGTCVLGVGSCHQILITPLHCAARMGEMNLAITLLEAGANPNAKTRVGATAGCTPDCYETEINKTPLDYAGTPEMKALLKKYGAK